jgi:THO complex subunit 1
MAIPENTAAVYAATRLIQLLDKARQLKPTTEIEPPLPSSEFQSDLGLPLPPNASRPHYFAAAEDAARHAYQERAASTPIQDPGFVEIWNLFDILSVCGDQEQCDPCLVWWLIEELLETQSIDGCRVVFEYMESRRERLVVNHFEKKNLVVLRAFNELLRRLSRAEEAVFCGRVFVFLFQSFPLGARSSVNLKGDFHKENLTTFEIASEFQDTAARADGDAMVGVKSVEEKESEGSTNENLDIKAPPLSTEGLLYPAFWTMQQAFSNPPEYFFKQNRIEEFKITLEATLSKFREVPKVNQAAADGRGVKREANELDDHDQFATTFNPKYLTSRELFALEVRASRRVAKPLLMNLVERSSIPTTYPGPSLDPPRFLTISHG